MGGALLEGGARGRIKKKKRRKRKRREKRRKDTDERLYLSSHSRAAGQLIKAIVNLGIFFFL
jgi:hypothetical protein